jgi:hypothetical protein
VIGLIVVYNDFMGDEERRLSMFRGMLSLSVAVSAVAIAVVSDVASAMPYADPPAIRNAAGTNIETVWGRGFGWGFGAGFLGGAIVGGALAPYYRYGYGYPYYGAYPYYGPYGGYSTSYSYDYSYRGRYPFDRQLCCRF